jgi:thiamine kinase-like enzyme
MTAREQIEQILARFPAGQRALRSAVEVESLSGGGINAIWRVGSVEGVWVVRLAGSLDASLKISREAEYLAQSVAAASGFAPTVLHAEPNTGLLVTEFLTAPGWSLTDVCSDEGIRVLGRRLRELHAVPVPQGLRQIDVRDVLAHYLALPDPTAVPVPRSAILRQLDGLLCGYQPLGISLCHNDPHHGNLVGFEPLRLIDWEYAGAGDPQFDLAAVISYHDYTPAQQQILLQAYGTPVDPTDIGRLSRAFDCLQALWLNAADGWGAFPEPRRDALSERLMRSV